MEAHHLKGLPMFLKKMFYASVSILLLALIYHVGSGRASAQSCGTGFVAVENEGGGGQFMGLAANGDVYTTMTDGATWTFRGHINGQSFVSLSNEGGGGQFMALESNGTTWVTVSDGAAWTQKGNIGGAATSARTQSFGALKASYR